MVRKKAGGTVAFCCPVFFAGSLTIAISFATERSLPARVDRLEGSPSVVYPRYRSLYNKPYV